MDSPTVSFVVPCYGLAHFLTECVESIVSQTYEHFEIIIMDDCSSDNTPDVARSFCDLRVRYVRNERNLGHLQNYNHGINISRGKYIWLISADDRLRCPDVLSRYVNVLEEHPDVGYVFCAGIGLEDGVETQVLPYYYYGAADKLFSGKEFILTVLRQGGGLLSPSVMARKECYEKVGLFPLDMPHQGDMFLWFAWALDYNVAYLAEPMVNYRSHDRNMMKHLLARHIEAVFSDEINVLWRIKRKVEEKGLRRLARELEGAIAEKYARVTNSEYCADTSPWSMSISECSRSLYEYSRNRLEYRRISALFMERLGDKQWRRYDFRNARSSYRFALVNNWKLLSVWPRLLLLLLQMGVVGIFIRNLRLRILNRQRRLSI